jgi:transaldolase
VSTQEHLAYRRQLLFETPPAGFAAACADLRAALSAGLEQADAKGREATARLLAELSIDIGSYLPRWHLLPPSAHDGIDQAALDDEIARNLDVLRTWGAEAHVQDVTSEVTSIRVSNLQRLSRLADQGRLNSRWGHDAVTGLTWAIRRGAVLVTTNPVMVNTVRRDDPTTWDPVRDAIRAAHPETTPQQRASLMTMDVVLAGCRELRPIWEATGGAYGYVSLQISPRARDDAAGMAREVEDLHARLSTQLRGEPNTRFKIPGTHAGLEAVRRLTSQGIGVTVTVSASVSQVQAFAEVIEQGTAPLSFLVLMMGRLDDPVRDELAAAGRGDAVELSRWASVAVLRRSYQLLFERQGFTRSAIMAASMRGPWTIDGSIVDGPSTVFITCFPDKAREYDFVERELVARQREPLPSGVEESLSSSATFRQAYDPALLSAEGFDSFVPVVQTLEQFSREYDAFVEYNR